MKMDDHQPTSEASMEGILQESDTNNLSSLFQAKSLSSSSSPSHSYKMGVNSGGEDERRKKTQKVMGKVVGLSSCGPQ